MKTTKKVRPMDDKLVTKEFCDERHKNMITTVEAITKRLDKHCDHLDITFSEIFKKINERNSKDSYNQGCVDTLNKVKYLSTKTLIALISLVATIVTVVGEIIVKLITR